MSQFAFLAPEWPALRDAAAKAESLVYPDPRAACFYARRALELAVHWIYKNDADLKLPYQENLSALIHEPCFRNVVGPAIFAKARLIREIGNQAVHSHKPIRQYDALMAVKELFHLGYWLVQTYGNGVKPAADLAFNPELLPKGATGGAVHAQTREELQKLECDLSERDEKLTTLLEEKAGLDAELLRLRAEVAAARKASAAKGDDHDYSEAETRDYFIDLLLKESGWALDQERDREFPVTGMPNEKGEGFVDYVLWGEDGIPLAVVEAKRTKRDPRVGQQQAKLYADCLEAMYGRRPVIFYTNGYDHWIWDDVNYPPRPVQGFYKRDELELMIQRRASRKSLPEAPINQGIVERFYQERAIRRIGDAFQKDHDRKALIVMATGAGKTRTVIALSDLLMRCNWAKRVLFLADRIALVKQAVNAFKSYLPDSAPVNLVTEKETEGRVYVSTYPTMMGLIDETKDGQRRFGPGHFDLIIIDEAHRSVFQKYRAIFDYFDSLLVGLTATPKDEVDRNTYSLFELENGIPTDAYPLEEAVKDGYLVPPKAVSVPLKFQREGISYDDLSEEEKEAWDTLEWDEEGNTPARVEAEMVNKWLFNKDTVDKVLEHLMTHGQKVAGGDRLGKTIIFAKNQAHAEFIGERFNANYPHYRGEFARVITFKTEYAQDLIEDFSVKDGAPHIAISVDMLDTGIDVPEVLNVVFFKLVRSKTKFWQMIGRGTRLCPDLFGPGQNKEFFYIFDFCQNLEFFSQNPEATEGNVAPSLGKKLFVKRLQMIAELDEKIGAEVRGKEGNTALEELRKETAGLLHEEVSGMNLENFVVRPKRRLIEKYVEPSSWDVLTNEQGEELARQVAGLPSEIETDEEEAKRFDLLILNLQLAVLTTGPGFVRLRDQVIAIAGLLEEKESIPMVRDHMVLIEQIQTEEYWEHVTVPLLENVRKRLRLLIKLIEKKNRKPIYTDFEDEKGEEKPIELPGVVRGQDFERFREKARRFLREHEDHITIHKLRTNEPLTASDLCELERILTENGIGTAADVAKAKAENHGLGIFVRSLVGMDREAAKGALDSFVSTQALTANQIEFLDEIVNHLTEHGIMDAGRLYESPYTDFNPLGVDGVFQPAQVEQIISILDDVKTRAVG